MEVSNISWVITGVRTEDKISEERLQELMVEAFLPDRIYHLFLCGSELEKEGTLVEMEEGFLMIKSQVEEYNEGDYCIISKHEGADLLFLPVIMDDENAEDFRGDIDSVQE